MALGNREKSIWQKCNLLGQEFWFRKEATWIPPIADGDRCAGLRNSRCWQRCEAAQELTGIDFHINDHSQGWDLAAVSRRTVNHCMAGRGAADLRPQCWKAMHAKADKTSQATSFVPLSGNFGAILLAEPMFPQMMPEQRNLIRQATDGPAAAGGAGNFVRKGKQSCFKSFGLRRARVLISLVFITAIAACTHQDANKDAPAVAAEDRVREGLNAIMAPKVLQAQVDSAVAEAVEETRLEPSGRGRLGAIGEVRLTSRTPLDILQVLDRLSQLSGFRFLVRAGLEGKVVASDASSQAYAGDGDQLRRPAQELRSHGLDVRFRLDHRGDFADMLDSIAERYGLAWEFDESAITFRQFITRTYRLAELPSRTEFSSAVGSASTAGSIDLSAETEDAIRLLSGEDAEVSFGRTSGEVTVTARPEQQRRVSDYVRERNEFLSRQVAFDVNVLTVSLSDAESFGIDLDLFAGSEEGDSIRWTGRHGLSGSSGTVNVGVLAGDVDLGLIIGALDRRGRVAVETRAGAVTSNNRMVPIQVVSETAYARKVEALSGSEGRSGTTIEPGTLTTGFELNLLPRLLPGGGILLSYSIRLSDLNELVEFTSDRQTIQLPKVSTTSFGQQAIIGDRQTLVLMGFERRRNSRDRSAGGGITAVFGGRIGSSAERVATVLTISPRILPSGAAAGASSDGR